MCKFYSAIITPTGEVLHNENLTSHEDLIALFGLNDDRPGRFARVEYTSETLYDLSTYTLIVDESVQPDWLTDEMLSNAERKLHKIVKKRIINKDTDFLVGGLYVVCGGATVKIAKRCDIVELYRGTVQRVYEGGTVQRVYEGGTVQEVWGGGTVQRVYGGGTVQEVYGGGTVQKVHGGGTVQEVYGGGTVQEVWGGGTVQKVWGGGTVIKNYNNE